jgi:hypothetical protein
MAEKLAHYPNIVDLLEEHEIGYHSSSHSVHPTIFEFTDVESYETAYQASLTRETSHINPLTGEIEGKGGILALRGLFPKNRIISYRAPGFCWSPPHTEMLRDLGINYEFSFNISSVPVYYKGLTFYPYPSFAGWNGKTLDYCHFLKLILKNAIVVGGFHPYDLVTCGDWDSIYYTGNPQQISSPHLRTASEFKSLFRSLDLFLKQLSHMEKMNLLMITTNLRRGERELHVTKSCVDRIYEHSMKWAKQFFNYNPVYLRNHFFKFFGLNY